MPVTLHQGRQSGVRSRRRKGQKWAEPSEALPSSDSPTSNCLTGLCVPINLLYNIHGDCFQSPHSFPPSTTDFYCFTENTEDICPEPSQSQPNPKPAHSQIHLYVFPPVVVAKVFLLCKFQLSSRFDLLPHLIVPLLSA